MCPPLRSSRRAIDKPRPVVLPLIPPLVAIIVKAGAAGAAGAIVHEGAKRAFDRAKRRPERQCPFCANMILAEAIVCQHCGKSVTPTIPPAMQLPTKPNVPVDPGDA